MPIDLDPCTGWKSAAACWPSRHATEHTFCYDLGLRGVGSWKMANWDQGTQSKAVKMIPSCNYMWTSFIHIGLWPESFFKKYHRGNLSIDPRKLESWFHHVSAHVVLCRGWSCRICAWAKGTGNAWKDQGTKLQRPQFFRLFSTLDGGIPWNTFIPVQNDGMSTMAKGGKAVDV